MPKSKQGKIKVSNRPKNLETSRIAEKTVTDMRCPLSPLELAEHRGYKRAQNEHTYSYNAAKERMVEAIGRTIQACSTVLGCL